MINTERTLNIFTTVLLDAYKHYDFANLTERERNIMCCKRRVQFIFFWIWTEYFNSRPSNIIPGLFTSLIDYKKHLGNSNLSLIR